MSKKFTISHLIIFICLIVLAFATYSSASEKDGLLKIYFLDVGQGDAEFIETPNGNQILIDGGPDNKVINELAKIMPFYDHSIDVVIATHPHRDHIAGLSTVLQRYDVAHVIQAEESYDTTEFKFWRQAVDDEHTDEVEAITGKVIDLGGNIKLTILDPFESVARTVTKTPHDDMVVTMLQYKNFKVLLTGDMEAPIEQALINYGFDLKANVLKVGHHGSKTSSTLNFLTAVQPQIAFIEVGAHNRYHHPSPIVLSRLENLGILYYRTDRNGTMKLQSDGQRFTVYGN